jgi:hypothetical protein
MKKCLFRNHARPVGMLVAGAAAVLAVAPAGASAALIATSSCDGAALSQPFAQWGDLSQYKLVPGGSFENGSAGWKLTGGAAIVSGSQPYGAGGSPGARSLSLPAGASAESPATCVNAAYPTFRLFARNSSLLASTAVQVVYSDPVVGRLALPVGALALSTSWRPSLPMLTGSAIQGVLRNGVAQVSLRFTSLTGSTTIDDVYVDPRFGH